MKKIFTLLAAVAMTVTASAQVLWTMSDFETANPAVGTETTFTLDGLTYNGRGSSAYAAGGTIEKDGYSFTFDKRLKIGGNSTFKTSSLKGVFEFEAEAGEPIIVFATHGSSSGDPRYIYVSNAPTKTDRDTNTAFGTLEMAAGEKGCMVATNPTSGKVYVWTGGNNAIYAIAKGYTLEELNAKMNGGSQEPEVPVEGTAFKVKGMGGATYGEEFDEISTPFSFDRANMTATFNNLFGSEASISIKFEQNYPAADPSVIGTMFDSKSATGIEEDGGEYAAYTIKNFTGSVVIKKDGVNYAKLENIGLWLGYYSQVRVAVEGSGDTAKKVYEVTFMIGGEYYPWDATTSSWGEKSKYNDNIELTTTIPFEEGGESGIDNIVTDSVDENAPVEYYNLQGIRLNEPAAGQIVIRRQGSKVSKIIVR